MTPMTDIPTAEMIERLRRASHRCYSISGVGDFNLDDIADRLEQLERERTWIPVSERLPEIQSDGWSVDVITLEGSTVQTNSVSFNGKTPFWQFGLNNPSHWMPFPVAPPPETT